MAQIDSARKRASQFSLALAIFRNRMKLDFRKAAETDILDLVNLLADDDLGVKREDISIPLNQSYIDAFYSIEGGVTLFL